MSCQTAFTSFLYSNCSAEPELFHGYDPNKKVFNQEVELLHDLEPIEISKPEKFKLQHGGKCDDWEVGTCLGSGMGGVTSMAKMFKDRRDEKEVQNDILQETCVIHTRSNFFTNHIT